MEDSQLANILKEFERYFGFSLVPDANHACLIALTKKLSIQIELDRYGMVIIGCRIVNAPPSSYRNSLITAALKYNEATPPSTGIFGFGKKRQQLLLYIKIDPKNITSQYIASILPPFIEKAKYWIETIEKNEIPEISPTSKPKSAGMFGL